MAIENQLNSIQANIIGIFEGQPAEAVWARAMRATHYEFGDREIATSIKFATQLSVRGSSRNGIFVPDDGVDNCSFSVDLTASSSSIDPCNPLAIEDLVDSMNLSLKFFGDGSAKTIYGESINGDGLDLQSVKGIPSSAAALVEELVKSTDQIPAAEQSPPTMSYEEKPKFLTRMHTIGANVLRLIKLGDPELLSSSTIASHVESLRLSRQLQDTDNHAWLSKSFVPKSDTVSKVNISLNLLPDHGSTDLNDFDSEVDSKSCELRTPHWMFQYTEKCDGIDTHTGLKRFYSGGAAELSISASIGADPNAAVSRLMADQYSVTPQALDDILKLIESHCP